MARVVVVCPDLLFGSKVEGGLRAAGHEPERALDREEVRSRLGERRADVLVVDLGAEELDGTELVEGLRRGGDLGAIRTLGFYPHVDRETRRRAEAGGFDLVVPRSRMAREMGALVDRLAPPVAAGQRTHPG